MSLALVLWPCRIPRTSFVRTCEMSMSKLIVSMWYPIHPTQPTYVHTVAGHPVTLYVLYVVA
jgi:hypothetical protein